MIVAGVIAEYNPFHQGHACHLRQTRAVTGADYVLAVMSGDFVQRGAPAMFDKYTRAEAALRNGADLVLELPPAVSTASAEYFAAGAVSLLNASGIVTDLCFGSECGDLKALSRLAGFLANEPKDYRQTLRGLVKSGKPFPQARAEALTAYADADARLLFGPNNLLGIEYLKALHRQGSGIRPHTVARAGCDYHDSRLNGGSENDSRRQRTNGQKYPLSRPPLTEEMTYASARAIRAALTENGGHFTEDICRQLPSSELYEAYDGKRPICEDDFSLLLLEKLRRLQDTDLSVYFDVNADLGNRIQNCLDDYRSFSQFADLLKTRNITRTAVSRALLHILLDIRGYRQPDALRVLGFRADARPLLTALTKRSSLPVIVNPSADSLPPDALYAGRLYESVRSLSHGIPYQNEFRRKMLVIEGETF